MKAIRRRELLLALSGMPLSAVAAGAATVVGAPGEQPPLDAARYVRLHWAPRGAWASWIYAGVLLVKPEGQVARPLVRIRGMSFSRAVLQPDGSLGHELDEVGYYCDLASGEPLDTLRNPFTDRDVKVAHYRSPQKLRFAGSSILPGQAMPPGGEFRGEVTTLAEVAGMVSMTEDLYVRLPASAATETRPARPERFSASLATFTAPAAKLADSRADWVDATLAYGTMNSFVGWLGMDGMAGVQNMRLSGVKRRPRDVAASVAPDLLARIRRDHPTFLGVPRQS